MAAYSSDDEYESYFLTGSRGINASDRMLIFNSITQFMQEPEIEEIWPKLWPKVSDYEFFFMDEMWDKGIDTIKFYVEIERNKHAISYLERLNNHLYYYTLFYAEKIRQLKEHELKEVMKKVSFNLDDLSEKNNDKNDTFLEYSTISRKSADYNRFYKTTLEPKIEALHKKRVSTNIISEYMLLIFKIAQLADGNYGFDAYNFELKNTHGGIQKLTDKSIYLKNNLYPLINEDGQFGFNTWLYAFFNRVFIIGCPERNSDFDFEKNASPAEFIDHDFTHVVYYFFVPGPFDNKEYHPFNKITMATMQKYINYGDHLYRKILGDKIHKALRMFFIFIMFLNYHEYTFEFNYLLKIEHYLIQNQHLFKEGKYHFAEICLNHISVISGTFGEDFLYGICKMFEPYVLGNKDYLEAEFKKVSAKYSQKYEDFEIVKPVYLRWDYLNKMIFSSKKINEYQIYTFLFWQYMKYSLNTLKDYFRLL